MPVQLSIQEERLNSSCRLPPQESNSVIVPLKAMDILLRIPQAPGAGMQAHELDLHSISCLVASPPYYARPFHLHTGGGAPVLPNFKAIRTTSAASYLGMRHMEIPDKPIIPLEAHNLPSQPKQGQNLAGRCG